MLLTFFYAYATIMQWWRLRSLKDKLKGTLNSQNALMVCSGGTVRDARKHRSLENLLFRHDDKIGCTVVPKQKLNLAQWISFPKNLRYFPIHIDDHQLTVSNDDQIFVLVQAILDNYTKHQSEIIQVESFGELVGWRASDYFEVILKTNIDNLTKLILKFSKNDVDINHELQLFKIETVDVEGATASIKYHKKYLKDQTLKYSYAPVHWKLFVSEIKELYAKIRDVTNPKIKIENGSTKSVDNCEVAKVPKKESVKKSREDKNTLDVSAGGDHRKHKHEKVQSKQNEKKKEVVKTKAKHNTKSKEETKVVVKKESKKVVKSKDETVKKSESKVETVAPSSSSGSKPPNVLVYSDSVITKDNVKRVLYSILNKEKYTIYDLPTNSKAWNSSTVLVVICGSVPPELTSLLIQYLINGGQLLCLCSDLMYSVLHTFTTAEVREHELVRFSYGSWQSVKMMHHIFCYQASPAKKQFSKDSDQSNHSSNGSSPLAPRTPSTVDLRYNDKDYNIQVQVLGTEETWQTPSLLLAKVKGSAGRAVFSQVHLEIDPEQYENDEDKYEPLRSSNEARLEILKDILSNHLDMVCDENFGTVTYSPGYFLGRYDLKLNMLSDCEGIVNNQLVCDKVAVVFCGNNVDPGVSTNIRLPVMIHSCPHNFSTLDYFETLKTEIIGRLVIYADILTSSQHLLDKKLRHGLVVIPKQQTNGVGRSSNSWLSPPGCATFSLQLHIPLDSPMGESLPLIQHLIVTAVVSAINNLEGYESLNLGIKWPNDLYVGSRVKIGGVVVNSIIISNLAVVNIGCGVNLSNRNPTVCINDIIEEVNKETGSSLKPIAYEQFFAIVFNEIEKLYDMIQNGELRSFLALYYKYWLHSGAEVNIETEEVGSSQEARVIGIDKFGFLSVRLVSGTLISVQPDGNSFDMMKGLIAPKVL